MKSVFFALLFLNGMTVEAAEKLTPYDEFKAYVNSGFLKCKKIEIDMGLTWETYRLTQAGLGWALLSTDLFPFDVLDAVI
jgi:hypothetical protein